MKKERKKFYRFAITFSLLIIIVGLSYFMIQANSKEDIQLWSKGAENFGEAKTSPPDYYFWIEFNGNGGLGTMQNQLIQDYQNGNGSHSLSKNQFTKTGYRFVDWNTRADGTGNSYDDEQEILGNLGNNGDVITLYAQWIEENTTVTVTFEYDGATGGTPSKEVKVGDIYGILPVPTKSGYIFAGWYKEKTYNNLIEGSTKVKIEENHTLYAKWIDRNETELHIVSGFGGHPTIIKDCYDGSSKKFHIPDKEPIAGGYYKFINYYTESKKGERLEFSAGDTLSEEQVEEIVDINSNIITLNCNWKTISTVTFEYNEATGGNDNSSIEVTEGEPYGNLPTPTKDRFSFAGWYKESDFKNRVTESTIVEAKENHTLYAKWDIIKSRTKVLIYNHSNPNLSNPQEYNVVYYDDNHIGIPSVKYTREGYKFADYYAYSKDGNRIEIIAGGQVSEENFNAIVDTRNNSISLYCNWKKISTVRFNYNEATGGDNNSSKEVIEGEEYGTLPVPTKGGYIFAGWYKEETYNNLVESSTEVKTVGDHTLYAKWIDRNKTVLYIMSEFNDRPYMYHDRFGYGNFYLPDFKPTQGGYKFINYYTENKRGERVEFSPEDILSEEQVDDIVDIDSNIITLNCNWKRAPTVTFEYNEATGGNDNSSIEVTEGEPYGNLPQPTKTGYEFKGWYKEGTYENQVTNETIVTEQEDHKLYAKWEKKQETIIKQATIKYETNRGNSIPNKIINIESDSDIGGTIPTPTREGYKFEGWYAESNFENEIKKYSDLELEEGKTYTIYAKWEKQGTEEPNPDDPNPDDPNPDDPNPDDPNPDDPNPENPDPSQQNPGQQGGQTNPKGNTTKTNNTVVSGDKTVTSLKMPKTGSNIILPIIIVTVATIIVGLYFKLKSLRDVR